MNSSFWILVFGGVFFIATVILQVYLSKRKSKVPGLVLPVLTFLIAVFAAAEVILAGVMYGGIKEQVHNVEVQNEEAVIQNEEAVLAYEEAVDGSDIPGTDSNDDTTYIVEDNSSFISGNTGNGGNNTADFYPPGEEKTGGSMAQFISVGVVTFFVYNLPTLLYGGIYIFFRKRKYKAEGGKNSAVDKMKIQDL